MEYSISSVSYLWRAKVQLDSGSKEGLFYAAFELRAGIEARMQEYLEPHAHIPKRAKVDYRISNLGRSLEKVSVRDKVVRFAIMSGDDDHKLALYYTPVTQALQKRAQRLGDLLHAPKRLRKPHDPWWDETKGFLQDTWKQLKLANVGTLLGSPMLRDKREASLAASVREHQRRQMELMTKGRRVSVQIEYLDEVPPDEIVAFDAWLAGEAEAASMPHIPQP